MKPILPYSILLSIAISPLALATDYGQIVNYNGTYSGDITVQAYTTAAQNGSVHRAINGTTNLIGNVSITNTGVNGSCIYLTTSSSTVNVTGIEGSSGQDMVFTTHKDGLGVGIFNDTANGIVNVDTKGHNLILQKSAGTATGTGMGLQAQYGAKINITAEEVHVNYSSSGESGGMNTHSTSQINITANAVYLNAKSYAIYVAGAGGSVSISGDVFSNTSNTAGSAISSGGTGTNGKEAIRIGGHTTLKGSMKYGVHANATNNTISLNGGLTISKADAAITAGGYAIYAQAAGSVIQDNAAANVGTLYKIDGNIATANATAKIDLHMGAGSTFEGSATKTSGTINLELSNGAQWTNTAASTMSNLNLLVNSTIAFNKSGTNTFYNINSAAVMLAEGSLLKVDLADTFTGDVTLFSGITTTTTTWNGGTDVENAILLNAAGTTKFIYTNPSVGVFRITGSVLIPEPTTASLTLLGLASLMMRRRRVIV